MFTALYRTVLAAFGLYHLLRGSLALGWVLADEHARHGSGDLLSLLVQQS